MMKLSEAIAERIKELKEQKGMTQYELFVRSGVPQPTISSLTRHLHDKPYMTIIYSIARGFNLTLKEFFDSPLFNPENIIDE